MYIIMLRINLLISQINRIYYVVYGTALKAFPIEFSRNPKCLPEDVSDVNHQLFMKFHYSISLKMSFYWSLRGNWHLPSWFLLKLTRGGLCDDLYLHRNRCRMGCETHKLVWCLEIKYVCVGWKNIFTLYSRWVFYFQKSLQWIRFVD